MKKKVEYRCNECGGYSSCEIDVPEGFRPSERLDLDCTVCGTRDTIQYMGANIWQSSYDRKRRGEN